MVKFIVVEDDEKVHSIVKEVISKAAFNYGDGYDIKPYTKYCKELQNEIEDETINKIYILDIELSNKISGIQIAEIIRSHDWDSEIIFVTYHDKMFESVYRNVFKVFAFIEKFHDFDRRLEKNISKILSKKNDNDKFVYGNNKINIQIYLKDITHIYRDTCERKLVINTNNNTYYIKMTINDIMKKLDNRFKIVHRACIVNTGRVTTFNWTKGYFLLDNKTKVDMLSKRYKTEVFAR